MATSSDLEINLLTSCELVKLILFNKLVMLACKFPKSKGVSVFFLFLSRGTVFSLLHSPINWPFYWIKKKFLGDLHSLHFLEELGGRDSLTFFSTYFIDKHDDTHLLPSADSKGQEYPLAVLSLHSFCSVVSSMISLTPEHSEVSIHYHCLRIYEGMHF